MYPLKSIIVVIFLVAFSSLSFSGDVEDVEKMRAEQIKKWGDTNIPKPKEVAKKAKGVLEKPFEQQTVSDLKSIAKESNKAANYVGFILQEYSEYYRDNYKYDFVQKKVAPYHDSYVSLANELRDYRNKAYYNLGKKLASSGNEVEAFFYYRDAYRLSGFTDDEGDHKGIRYLAEQEMKSLMGLNDLESFVYWK